MKHFFNSLCTMSQSFFPQFASVTATATVAFNHAGHGIVGNSGQPEVVASRSRKVSEQKTGRQSGCVSLSPLSSSGILEMSDMSLPESSSTICIATVTPGSSHYAENEALGNYTDQHCFHPSLLPETASNAPQYHLDSNADDAGGWANMRQQEVYCEDYGCCLSNGMGEEAFQDSSPSWFHLDCYHQNDQRAGNVAEQFDFTNSIAAVASRNNVMHSDEPFIPNHMNFSQSQYDCSSTTTGPFSNDISSSFYETENVMGTRSNTLNLVHPLQHDATNCTGWFETDLDDPLSYMNPVPFKGTLNEDIHDGNTLETKRRHIKDQDSIKCTKRCETFDEEILTVSSIDATHKTKNATITDVSKTNSAVEPSKHRDFDIPICSWGETNSVLSQNRVQQEQEQPTYTSGRLQANPTLVSSQPLCDPITLPINCPANDFYSVDHQHVPPTFLDSLHQAQPDPREVAKCTACPSQPHEPSTTQARVPASHQHAENGHTSSPVIESDNSSCSYGGSGVFDSSSLSSSSSPSSSSGKTASLIDVDHLLSSGVTVAGFKPRPIIRKRRKVMMPSTQKDGSYWQKRKKNNDSAKRSREAKKEKEMNFYRRALELEYENYFLKERLEQLESQLRAITGVTPPPLDYAALAARASGGVDSAAGLHNYSVSSGAMNSANVQHTSTDNCVT